MGNILDQRTERQKKIDLVFKRHVLNGIRLLEEKYGPDWVELGREQWEKNFDIRVGDRCVLGGIGQSLGHADPYAEMLTVLSLDDAEEEWQYGFTTPDFIEALIPDERNLSPSEEWDSLQRLWEAEFAERGVKVG